MCSCLLYESVTFSSLLLITAGDWLSILFLRQLLGFYTSLAFGSKLERTYLDSRLEAYTLSGPRYVTGSQAGYKHLRAIARDM